MQDTDQYKQQSDDQLAAQCARGDRGAFAALYERYFQGVYDFAVRTVRDLDIAAEAVQNSFITVWESTRGGQREGSVKARLYAVARNSAIEETRRRTRLVSPADAGPRADCRRSLRSIQPGYPTGRR